jgi:hypothetical protein
MYKNVQYLLNSTNITNLKKKTPYIADFDFTVTIYTLSSPINELFGINENKFIGKDTVFKDSSLLGCDAVTGKVVPSILKERVTFSFQG